MTDQQSQQRINEAAEQFTDALVQSYKVVAGWLGCYCGPGRKASTKR
jgi:hypothetical protein